MFGRNWNDLHIQVRTPPDIPAQNNAFDCGVFLLTFSKYLVYNKEFNFSNDDMPDIREDIKIELGSSKIHNNFGSIHGKKVRKRFCSPHE